MKKLFLMAALLLLPLAASNAQSAEELLQQALVLERSEGDYAGAIALYRLVAESAEFDRAVTGRALVQMAMAYENMGRVEAARTYERVLVEYGDLPELAAEAREGFARTREPIEQPSTPEPGSTSVVDVPDEMNGWGRAMSPKGTFIAGPVRNPAGVMVVNTHTRQESVFYFPAEAYAEVYTVRFSPDESQIATTVWQHDGDCVLTRTPRCQFDTQSSKVFILDLETGSYSPVWDNLAYYQNREGPGACDDPEVHDWSADGSKLLLLSPWEPVCAEQPWVGEDLILLDIASGEPTVLGNLLDNQGEESYYETSCLSQDGRYAFTDVVVDNDSWAIRRYDTATKETHIWRSIGKNTWLWGCSWDPDRILYASQGIAGTSIGSGHPASLDSGDDPVVMQLPEGAWSIHSPKSGDTAFYRSDNTRRDIHIGRLGESDQLTDTRPLGERTFRNLAWRPGPERQLAWVDTAEPAIVVAPPGGTTDLRIPLQSARRATGFRWVNADLVFVSERSEDTRQPWHGLVLDLEGRAVNQMRATTADSLEIQVPKALDHRRWIAWSYDRDCIVEVAEKQLTRELKCFETDRYLSFSFVPSPWDERVLVRGFRPDSSAVQAVLDVETTEYRELIEDPTWVGTAWTSFDWVAPGFVTHGVDGWKQLLLINVETGERRPILSDLMREIEPNTLSIDLEQGWVALTGEGKKWTSPDRNTLTIVHGILDGEQAGGGR